jgi:hypothetical protein
MQKVARTTEVWARGDRKCPVNDIQIPNFRGVRVHVSTGHNRVEGNRRASRNGRVSSSSTRNPYRYTIRDFCIAERGHSLIIRRGRCVRVAGGARAVPRPRGATRGAHPPAAGRRRAALPSLRQQPHGQPAAGRQPHRAPLAAAVRGRAAGAEPAGKSPLRLPRSVALTAHHWLLLYQDCG